MHLAQRLPVAQAPAHEDRLGQNGGKSAKGQHEQQWPLEEGTTGPPTAKNQNVVYSGMEGAGATEGEGEREREREREREKREERREKREERREKREERREKRVVSTCDL
jgi:hypothetical protein